MDYIITSISEATAHFEVSVDTGGFKYNIIYGEHLGGGFIAIPNHGIACEAGPADDLFYNAEKLMHQGLSRSVARAIAYAIRDAAACAIPNA